MGISITSSLKIRRRRLEYLTSGVWTPPNGVTQVIATVVAGGASGGAGYSYDILCGGGAGGMQIVSEPVTVTPGVSVPVVVGSGGSPVSASGFVVSVRGQNGGNSSFGSLTAIGGGPVTPIHATAGVGASVASDATRGFAGRSAGGGAHRIRVNGSSVGGDSSAGRGTFSLIGNSTHRAFPARPNSGSGGGAAWGSSGYDDASVFISGAGGSGIVIVEWEERA